MSNQQEIPERIIINGREATTATPAALILSERARAAGYEKEYKRNTVYVLFRDGKIEGTRMPTAIYYYVDSLNTVRIDPSRGGKPSQAGKKSIEKEGYPPTVREEAFRLLATGMSRENIAKKLGTSKQTIGNWIRKQTNS